MALRMSSLRKVPHEWCLMSGFANSLIAYCANSLILADSNKAGEDESPA